MYGWIFRHLPGPTWLKAVWSLLLIGAAVYLLFTYGFPWAQDYFNLNEAEVG